MTNASINMRELARDPSWFPHALDARQGVVACVKIARDRLAAEPFLDQRMEKSVTGSANAPLNALIGETQPAGLPSFIFHTAFCCSTLMAKALDARGAALALKEPNILMDVSNLTRMATGAAAGQQAQRNVAGIVNLLARRHEAGERILIKPTNTANNLAPVMAASGAPVVFLYGDLRAFLVSVLKKGEACKAFIRKQYTIFMLDKEGVAGIPERQGLGLTDLQIAALVWRHQMELFAKVLAQYGAKNVRSLYFRDLLMAPQATLAAAAKHLKLEISDKALSDNVAAVFSKNAKFENQEYTPEERSRDEQSLEDRHRTELDMIEGWAKQMRFAVDVPDRLPHSLVS
ncbi:hypothetical protein [Hyphococcus sp.]|uniref:hypothetical protein n=1 Tax=Hyphococcus sp. TaxID=2038636 RepID=UPI00208945A8|nr:MAG: hypothetical protein DHS20C04_29830 [Marinicaulis sp.]